MDSCCLFWTWLEGIHTLQLWQKIIHTWWQRTCFMRESTHRICHDDNVWKVLYICILCRKKYWIVLCVYNEEILLFLDNYVLCVSVKMLNLNSSVLLHQRVKISEVKKLEKLCNLSRRILLFQMMLTRKDTEAQRLPVVT